MDINIYTRTFHICTTSSQLLGNYLLLFIVPIYFITTNLPIIDM